MNEVSGRRYSSFEPGHRCCSCSWKCKFFHDVRVLTREEICAVHYFLSDCCNKGDCNNVTLLWGYRRAILGVDFWNRDKVILHSSCIHCTGSRFRIVEVFSCQGPWRGLFYYLRLFLVGIPGTRHTSQRWETAALTCVELIELSVCVCMWQSRVCGQCVASGLGRAGLVLSISCCEAKRRDI